MRGVRLGETWIEVERVRHPLTAAISAQLGEAELRVSGEDWSARLVLAPGAGPLRAASEAAARIKAGSRGARDAAHRRLHAASELGREHAAACHAAATALAAGDGEVAQLHADRTRLDNCLDELATRLGHRTPGEPAEVAAARGRLEQARLYLERADRAAVRLGLRLAQARRRPDAAGPAGAGGGRGPDARAAGRAARRRGAARAGGGRRRRGRLHVAARRPCRRARGRAAGRAAARAARRVRRARPGAGG